MACASSLSAQRDGVSKSNVDEFSSNESTCSTSSSSTSMSPDKANYKRYYIRQTIVPFEEDSTHEFKGHKNLSFEEMPEVSKGRNGSRPSRQPISRIINAFLNTAKGGTVYMGILDDGTVNGFHLTQLQEDHTVLAVEDLMERYKPPVPKWRYSVNFIPVVEHNSTDEEIQRQLTYNPGKKIDKERRLRPHALRIQQYCWCDKENQAMYNNGVIPPSYVIEIEIKPWDQVKQFGKEKISTGMNLHPIHQNEEGRSYFRRSASIQTYSKHQLVEMTKLEVLEVYRPHLQRLRQEVQRLKLKNAGQDYLAHQ